MHVEKLEPYVVSLVGGSVIRWQYVTTVDAHNTLIYDNQIVCKTSHWLCLTSNLKMFLLHQINARLLI